MESNIIGIKINKVVNKPPKQKIKNFLISFKLESKTKNIAIKATAAPFDCLNKTANAINTPPKNSFK